MLRCRSTAPSAWPERKVWPAKVHEPPSMMVVPVVRLPVSSAASAMKGL